MSEKKYIYGMRLRPFGIGCQPKFGFLERRDDTSNMFWDLIVYNRKLSEFEREQYDLEFVGEEDG